MHNATTPEDLAKEFARRWFSHESPVVRELGERELIQIIRIATAAERSKNSTGHSDAP